MILRRFMQHVREQNWFAVGLDVLVVIVGIFLGLQVQAWYDDQEEAVKTAILAQSMIEDLEADVKTLNQTISFSENKIISVDGFMADIHEPRESWDPEKFYIDMSLALRIAPFKSTDGTYQQLKASGSLQLFDQQLVNKMNAYDHQIKYTEFRDNIVDRAEADFLTLSEGIINFYAMLEYREEGKFTRDLHIRFEDDAAFGRFISSLTKKREVLARAAEEYRVQLALAEDLLADLKAAYPGEVTP